MRLNINTALITSKQKGNQNIAVISNYFWFDYSLKPYVSCIDAVFIESEEKIRGRGAVYGYFVYSLLNIAHNYGIRPDTHYPTVLGENESEKSFSATPVAKKGLSDLFINILPSTIDGFAISYRLVSDGQNIGFGVKDGLKVGGDIYKFYPNFARVMKLPDEDLLIKRANFPIRIRIRRGKKKGRENIELPTLIDGLFSKTLNKHIGIIPDRVLNSPRLEHLPQDWITWEDYRPVVCGQSLDTYELITPPDEDVADFVNYLKSTYNKPVYLLVSVEFLQGSAITHSASVRSVSQFINSLSVDGVVIQDDFSEGSWVAGTVNPAISTFLRNLYSQINKPKFYLPSYSTVKHVSFQNDTVSISESRNQLFNQTKHGCIYTPPLIPFKECGYTYGGYNANICDHANYYLQKENKPVLKYEEFMKVYPSLIFIDEPDKMYKPPNLLLNGLNNIVLKQHFFDEDVGLIQFADIQMAFKSETDVSDLRMPIGYKFSEIYGETTARTNDPNYLWKLELYSMVEYSDGSFELELHEIKRNTYRITYPAFFMSKYLGLIYIDFSSPGSFIVLKPILTESPVFLNYPVSGYEINFQGDSLVYRIDFGAIGSVRIEMNLQFYYFGWETDTNDPEILAKRKQIECDILYPSAFVILDFSVYYKAISLGKFYPFLPSDYYSPWRGREVIAFGEPIGIKGKMVVDLLNLKSVSHRFVFTVNNNRYRHVDVLVSDLAEDDKSHVIRRLKLDERFFSTVIGIEMPAVLSNSNCVEVAYEANQKVFRLYSCDKSVENNIEFIERFSRKTATFWDTFFTSTPAECLGLLNLPMDDYDINIERGKLPQFRSIETVTFTLQSAFYYQVYSLNHLATQLRGKINIWNAFYLTPFWQVFEPSQDNMISFYYIRIPYNFLAYFINIEADREQVNCCVNPRIVRSRPPSGEISLNISIPQLPISNVFTGGNEGQFTWLTPEQSSLLNLYNYVNSKLTTHKPFLIPLYEKFYRRVDKQAFLEPVLVYVKGGQVFITGQYKGIFAYTLPEHTDKVFLAVYRESANEFILAIGEDLIMADVIEYEDVGLGTLISQENPFVFYKTHIAKTGEVEKEGNKPIVRFVDLP